MSGIGQVVRPANVSSQPVPDLINHNSTVGFRATRRPVVGDNDDHSNFQLQLRDISPNLH
jgi:hypothetical protein